MPPRDQQGHKRELRRVGTQERREQMAFEVVHAQHRLVQRGCHGTGCTGADQQSPGKTGSARKGNHIDIFELLPGFGQHLLGQRQHTANMVTAGKLGHHAAIGAVHFNLAVQRMTQQGRHTLTVRRAHQGHTGFITRGFDSQDQQTHGRKCRTCALQMQKRRTLALPAFAIQLIATYG